MESTEKLTDTNAILAYLYDTFPLCFIREGEAKPLKIGLFQELAEKLANDPKVSKTQLRVAVRRYTNSWRYLRSIKPGAQRIDLDGNACGELDNEHIEYAQKTLKESQAKAKERRDAQAAKNSADKKTKSTKKARSHTAKSRNSDPTDAKKRTKPAPVNKSNLVQAELSQLTPKQRVNVKLGMTPVAGIILDINKDDVHVQLDSGLSVKVRAEHILL